MTQRWRGVLAGALIMAGILGGVLIGCSESPTSSDDDVLQQITAFPVQSTPGPLLSTGDDVEGSEIKDEDGGRVDVAALGDDSYLRVERGSMSLSEAEILVRIANVESGKLNIHDFTFGPAGLEFDPAATLVIDAAVFADEEGRLPRALVWVYYDHLSREWSESVVISLSEDGTFEVPIHHFSIYRMGTDFDGISLGGQ